MRLVDFYIPAILYSHEVAELAVDAQADVETISLKFDQFYQQARMDSEEAGFDFDTFQDAWYAVVAYVDEKLLTTKWAGQRKWMKYALQRKYFQTTNAGADFYTRLNTLNKHGDGRSIREVFLLCLGLGFKGKFYPPADRPKLESVREFNMGLLLPDEAKTNLEDSILFRSAFSKEQLEARDPKRRMTFVPFLVGLPITVVGGFFMYYAVQIRNALNDLVNLVN